MSLGTNHFAVLTLSCKVEQSYSLQLSTTTSSYISQINVCKIEINKQTNPESKMRNDPNIYLQKNG